MIDLLLLGTGGMMPLPSRWLSSLLVRCQGELTLFDCGEGTQIPWQIHGWGFRRVGAICLSHLHADHVAGLPGLLHAIANAGRTEPVVVYGPPGTARVVEGLRLIAPVLEFDLAIEEIRGGAIFRLPGPLQASAFDLDHRVPCLGYRLERSRRPRFAVERAEQEGIPRKFWRSLQDGEPLEWEGRRWESDSFLGPPRSGLAVAFVTDTRPLDGLAEFVREVELLVCEGTYGDTADQQKAIDKKHMTFAEAATLARDAGAKSLWLTHFSPSVTDPLAWRDDAASIFPQVTVGYSGLSVSIAFADTE